LLFGVVSLEEEDATAINVLFFVDEVVPAQES